MPNKIKLTHNMTLLKIPKGKFMMGSDNGYSNAKPVHPVTIGYDFYMGQTEVTFDQYEAYVQAENKEIPDDRGWGKGTRPVIYVDWNDAQDYAKWLSQNNSQGLQCRLPSEAEWEYAARAGTTTEYFWGDDIGRNQANCDGCGSEWDNKQTAPVGSFKSNQFGLQDMHGNVWEWTQDCWHSDYQDAPKDGSAWETQNSGDCTQRVLRGGSWLNSTGLLRSANRNGNFTEDRNFVSGFRLVCVPPLTDG